VTASLHSVRLDESLLGNCIAGKFDSTSSRVLVSDSAGESGALMLVVKRVCYSTPLQPEIRPPDLDQRHAQTGTNLASYVKLLFMDPGPRNWSIG